MPTLEQREQAIRDAKKPPCQNCGQPGSHFVPPSLGETGFYTCVDTPPPVSRKCVICNGSGECTGPYRTCGACNGSGVTR